ncbi:phospholipase D-like domain-containing protein [Xanthomonas hortorum]|uniref:phospholipase D-like domain-containing protein n=3 Tax=Xanthomonas hortorum TaxID=56454 RepID=UPI0032E8A08A
MKSSVELVVNGTQVAHVDALLDLLERAEHLDCMVAFAKSSALKSLLKPLTKALERGMTARFAVGLSFHLTEPAMLRKLMSLRKEHQLALYLSDTKATFHPKIYAFSDSVRSTVLVGSANLTSGGLADNYEASVLVTDPDGSLAKKVAAHFDELISEESIVAATKKRIDDYAQQFTVQEAWRKMAHKRAERISREGTQDLSVLAYQLDEMKRNKSSSGFAAQQTARKKNLMRARQQIKDMATLRRPSASSFLPAYNQLIDQFHSGGLHRQNTRMAEQSARFIAALADIVSRSRLSPETAFEVLHHHFDGITGAGINLLTEVLHTLDNKRYAVMNQNAVSGLAAAGITGYPLHPSKGNVNGQLYAMYCQHAQDVQQHLGLTNLSELDALFNYLYWQQEEDEEGQT